jgi:glycosyltransferase involved in cell wall biosynthesis
MNLLATGPAWAPSSPPAKTKVKKLVGIIGSGRIARDPFNRSTWSGSSYFFFTEIKRQGFLHRAFGVEVPAWKRYWQMARNFNFNRTIWREHFYMDLGYRAALTEEIRQQLQAADYEHDLLHVGAMYNVGRLAEGKTRCFSYHDGNLAELLRSPYAPKGLSDKVIDGAMAYERAAHHSCAKIFTMSEHIRQSFITDFGMPADRVVAIGGGINFDSMPEPVSDKRYDSREVLFIGIDFPRKGGWELLKAWRGVMARFPQARLHLVGPKELVIPPELQAGVEYHGFLSKFKPDDQAKLNDLFRRSCLFVMPSLYEPFGIAPLEAMVYQIPCIVTNRWALKEMVTPGQTGDLVECGSADDLEAKLTSLLADPEGLRRMGETGRKMALEKYTWEKVIDRLRAAVAA